ncbi:MAG TPA: CheR family methyltransferase [Anaeromyxobacter sp.]|nr:CheR family methyltransferase [Anaeromyxobacter sp.]
MSPGSPSLAEVARILADEAGLSLGDGLDRALGDGLLGAASALGVDAAAVARRVVARDPAALAALVEHAAVVETAFWRHPEQLAAAARTVSAATGPARIWSAGCATGEEPYSVAIALLEAGRTSGTDRILATDVSTRALESARAALYGERTVRRLPFDVAARWLEPGVPRRVAPEVRALVTFERHNLVRDPVPADAHFDVVLCRNVLIYFGPETAAAVLYRLVGALRPGGVLVLGPVELPLARALDLEWVEDGGATLLRRPK